MQKSKNKLLFGSLKIMACASILAAMSIVLGKYLAFNVTQDIRISFENLPIMIAGIFFGPVVGAVILTLLPEVLRFLSDYRLMINGAIIVLAVLFMPRGLLAWHMKRTVS